MRGGREGGGRGRGGREGREGEGRDKLSSLLTFIYKLYCT